MELAAFRILYTLLSALLIVPLWVGPHPPLIDLPQHAGQVSAALAWLAGSSTHRAVFELNPFTPYLGSYLVAGPLVALFGPSTGLRLALSLALLALPLATSHLLRTVRAPAWWVIPVFAVAPSYAFHWGFLGFVVATPLGIWGLSVHLRYLDDGSPRRALASAALALACFVAHALVFAWLALTAGLVTWLRGGALRGGALRGGRVRGAGQEGGAPRRVRLLGTGALLTPVPLALLWLARTVGGPGRADGSVVWNLSWDRLGALPSRLVGGLRGDAPLELLGLLLFASPFLLGARFQRGPAGWAALGATLALCLLGPDRVMSATYLPWRFAVFLIPTLLLTLRPRSASWSRHRVAGLAAVVAVAALSNLSNLRSFRHFAAQSSGFREVAALIPPGARVAYLAFGKATPQLRGPAFLHFGQWAQAERQAIVDFSFAEFFPEVVRYRPGQGSGWPPAAEWYPHLFDYPARHGNRYQYFLVCSDRPLHEAVYRGAPAPGALLAQSGYFWLYSAPPPAALPEGQAPLPPAFSSSGAPRTPEPRETENAPASR